MDEVDAFRVKGEVSLKPPLLSFFFAPPNLPAPSSLIARILHRASPNRMRGGWRVMYTRPLGRDHGRKGAVYKRGLLFKWKALSSWERCSLCLGYWMIYDERWNETKLWSTKSFTDYFESMAAIQRGQALRDILNDTALLQAIPSHK